MDVIDPQNAQVQSTQNQTAQSQVVQPQNIQPQTVQPQNIQNQTVQSQATQPQNTQPVTVQQQSKRTAKASQTTVQLQPAQSLTTQAEVNVQTNAQNRLLDVSNDATQTDQETIDQLNDQMLNIEETNKQVGNTEDKIELNNQNAFLEANALAENETKPEISVSAVEKQGPAVVDLDKPVETDNQADSVHENERVTQVQASIGNKQQLEKQQEKGEFVDMSKNPKDRLENPMVTEAKQQTTDKVSTIATKQGVIQTISPPKGTLKANETSKKDLNLDLQLIDSNEKDLEEQKQIEVHAKTNKETKNQTKEPTVKQATQELSAPWLEQDDEFLKSFPMWQIFLTDLILPSLVPFMLSQNLEVSYKNEQATMVFWIGNIVTFLALFGLVHGFVAGLNILMIISWLVVIIVATGLTFMSSPKMTKDTGRVGIFSYLGTLVGGVFVVVLTLVAVTIIYTLVITLLGVGV